MDNAIVVKNVSKTFTTRKSGGRESNFLKRSGKVTRNVLNNISFEIKKGEVFGIIGRNGSGKSTLLKMISMIMKPDSGSIKTDGKVASILELGMGFHQDLSGKENIHIKGSMYGFTKKEIDRRIDAIVKYAELEDYIDLPVRVYSSGMSSRLAFAIMINVDADIVILDEVFSTGDLAFSTKSGAYFSNMKNEGKTIVLVSHSMSNIRSMCDRVAWIDNGVIREIGPPNVVCGHFEAELSESLEVIMELANSGVPKSQNTLGCMHRDGYKVEEDKNLAKDWFEKAANRDYDPAKINLADMLISEGTPEGRERAIDLYMSAAGRGNREARNKISRLLVEENSNVEREIIEDFTKLTTSNNPQIMFEFADLLLKTAWSNEDRLKAFQWFKKASDLGHVNSMHQIALMYRDGNGVSPNNSKYIEWLLKASENGHVQSQLLLGNMYRDGIKVESDEIQAFKWYELAAINNNPDAIYQIASMYRNGKGVEKNRDESERWLKKYSEQNLFRQINSLAESFSYGKNGVYNLDIGKRWYSVNAEHNHPDSKYRLAMLAGDDKNFFKNRNEVLNTLESSAKNGHVNASICISTLYGMGIADEYNLNVALEALDKLARGGNPWAANVIGNMYFIGNTVDQDVENAMEYLTTSSDLGNIHSMQKLGEMYRDGMLIEQNFDEATKWFEKGIIGGNVNSALSLINMYVAETTNEGAYLKALNGLENIAVSGNVHAMRHLGNHFRNCLIKQDYKKACQWYELASKLGDLPSMFVLGEMYRDGIGVEKDVDEAVNIFKNAAKLGHTDSAIAIMRLWQSNQCDEDAFRFALCCLERFALGGNVNAMRMLGTLFSEGKYVPEDIEKAKKWFEKSSVLGDIFSRDKLKSL